MQAKRSAAVKRIAVAGPDGASLLRLRGGLIRDLIGARHSVLCLAPDLQPATAAALDGLGARTGSYFMMGEAPQLLGDRRSVAALGEHFAEWRPHVVLGYGAKAMALAALATARTAGIRSVSLVSELGPVFARDQSAPGWSWRRLLRSSFKATHAAVFHNGDDLRRLEAHGLLPDGLETLVVAGGGVDLGHFAAVPLPSLADGLTFVMIAALDEAKGIREFSEAAAKVHARAPTARFILVGPDGSGPGAVSRAAAAAAGPVEIVVDQADVRPWLGRAHVFVLPSHCEGMSRTLIEALALGRPVIASNIPGCREAVDERVNGILVPPRDATALADAMQSLLKRPDLLPAMARSSRLKAERRFDVRDVNRELFAVMGLA